MKGAIEETNRRRLLQEKYNTEHGIVPATVVTRIKDINPASGTTDYFDVPKVPRNGKGGKGAAAEVDLTEQLRALRTEMFTAAENLEFERAAKLRDELKRLEALAGKNGAGESAEAAYDPYASTSKKARSRSGDRARAGGGGRGRYRR
jgi:excinuclease ABC subunit B